MKLLKQIIFFSLTFVVMMSFSQCASAKKIEKKAPIIINEVHYKEWSNPARYTGSGLNLFIIPAAKNEDIVLDSVYFRNKQVKLNFVKDSIYVGKFETDKNKPVEIIMSIEPKEEFGNKALEKEKPFPFELKDHECVVSFKQKNKTKYFKIINITKKQTKGSLYQRM